MKKITKIDEFLFDKETEENFENFIPIWQGYWNDKAPSQMLLGQVITSSRLLQLAIIANMKFDMLDKKQKLIIKKDLESIINQLK